MYKNNPFPYSDDNKRYHTWNYYLQHRFHQKVFKAALNANFTCPNRDGTCGVGGCTFCSALGSGDFAGSDQDSLFTQFEKQKQTMLNKWPTGKAIAYFQAFTNTYAPMSSLQATFDPFVHREDVLGLSIATRADCLGDDIIAYLDSLCDHKEIWIEIGLQSIHDQSSKRINRGHTYYVFLDCIQRLSKTRCKICVHLMNALPYESKEDMIESAKAIAHLPIQGVKIHMLHIMEDTVMAKEYLYRPFPLLTKEEYIDIVVSQLECLPKEMIIQRLTGDGERHKVIAPKWTLAKRQVLNDIDKAMLERNTWQGKQFL